MDADNARQEAAQLLAASMLQSAQAVDQMREHYSGSNEYLNQVLWDLEAVALGHAQRAAEEWWKSSWSKESACALSLHSSSWFATRLTSTSRLMKNALGELYAGLTWLLRTFIGMLKLPWRKRQGSGHQVNSGSATICVRR